MKKLIIAAALLSLAAKPESCSCAEVIREEQVVQCRFRIDDTINYIYAPEPLDELCTSIGGEIIKD